MQRRSTRTRRAGAAPGPDPATRRAPRSTARSAVLGERLRRQRLLEPLPSRRGYEDLFRLLQPVSTYAAARPGDPPRLVCRTTFDDGAVADRLRARRKLVKGRFLGGTIGYLLARDLALYANAFRRPLPKPSPRQGVVLDAVRAAGPVTPRQLREETGLLNKEIMPALHRLQTAFLVYEDQPDREWDRGWYEFASEWSEVELSEERRGEAIAEVLRRFLRGHVFATFEQLRDWSRLSRSLVASAIGDLERGGAALASAVEGLGEGWLDPGRIDGAPDPESVFMLHRADPIVRPHASDLARRFGDLEVLQYLMVDGALAGAVTGHWRFAPYDIEDIVLELPARRRSEIRERVLQIVREVYRPPRHQILRYAGRPLGH
jgi:hypothetical protein